MQRWKEEFTATTQRKCVNVHHNGDFEHGKGKNFLFLFCIFSEIGLSLVLYLEPDWSCLDFLNAASQRLNMVPAAKRLFNSDGQFQFFLSTACL
jgi:hypothetical protein